MNRHTGQRSALDILRQDHRKVRDLFEAFEESEDVLEQKQASDAVINEIRRHARIEESIFYPALKEAATAHHLVDQAQEEQQEIEAVLKDLEEMDPEDPLFADKFLELEDRMMDHIQQTESELFRQAEESGLELVALGETMARTRQAGQEPPFGAASPRSKQKRTSRTPAGSSDRTD